MAEFRRRYPDYAMSQGIPGPLEDFARQLDDLFGSLAQRRGFRDYLPGLLLPRDRNKTLTALIGAEPVVGAQHREVQRVQFVLAESPWQQEEINARRLAGLRHDPATRAHENGVRVVDETGGRQDGTKTAHASRQYLGSIGKTDPALRTKPRLAVALVDAALAAGVSFRAVVADCLYGDNPTFEGAMEAASLPFVLGIKPSPSIGAPGDAVHRPEDAVAELRWNGSADPGDWTRVIRTFRDGPTETGWAVALPPPRELQDMLGWVADGRPLNLYLRV